MTPWRRRAVAALDDLATTGVAQRSLRLLALLAAVTAWMSGVLAGAGDSPVAFTVLLAAAGWCAVAPDTQAGLLVPVAIGWQWLVHLDRTTSGWVLVAALCLLLFHAATATAACAPAAAALPRGVIQPLAERTATIALVTAAVWLAVRWSPLTGRPGHPGLTVAAFLVLTAAAAAAAKLLPRRPTP